MLNPRISEEICKFIVAVFKSVICSEPLYPFPFFAFYSCYIPLDTIGYIFFGFYTHDGCLSGEIVDECDKIPVTA